MYVCDEKLGKTRLKRLSVWSSSAKKIILKGMVPLLLFRSPPEETWQSETLCLSKTFCYISPYILEPSHGRGAPEVPEPLTTISHPIP